MNERRPIVKACSDTIADGDRRCNSCGGNRFSTVRPDATCDELCQKYRECEREVDATARDMVRASTERSVSLTSGGRRGQVQMQLVKIPVSVVDVVRTKVVGAVVNMTMTVGGNLVSQRETCVLLIMREKQ